MTVVFYDDSGATGTRLAGIHWARPGSAPRVLTYGPSLIQSFSWAPFQRLNTRRALPDRNSSVVSSSRSRSSRCSSAWAGVIMG